jgi:hypothetical protein
MQIAERGRFQFLHRSFQLRKVRQQYVEPLVIVELKIEGRLVDDLFELSQSIFVLLQLGEDLLPGIGGLVAD